MTRLLQGRRLLWVLLVVHAALLAWSARIHSPTQDEIAHLPAGLAIWKFSRFDLYRVNPPLVRMLAAVPVLCMSHEEDWSSYRADVPQRIEFGIGTRFVEINGARTVWLMTVARWICIPFSLLGLWGCWCWGEYLFDGKPAAAAAATLWCFSPNLIGHGALITPDVAAVSMGIWACYWLAHWRESPNLRHVFLAGLLLGLALLTKTYWIVLLGLCPLFGLYDECRHFATRPPQMRVGTRLGQSALIVMLAVYVLGLGYQGRDVLTPLKDYIFYSEALSGHVAARDHSTSGGNRFRSSWLGEIPVPLPRDFVTGIDLQKIDFEQGKENYLLGVTLKNRGWWYYYLVGLAVKVPLSTWLLFCCGGAVSVFHWRAKPRAAEAGAEFWQRLLPLLLAASLLLLLASLQSNMNRHLRYVFIVLPVFYLIGARVMEAGQGWARLAGVLIATSVLSCLSVYPHCLGYFNALAGGPSQGGRVLNDSSLDWGQDNLFVQAWLKRHPERKPVWVAGRYIYPLRHIGIEIDELLRSPRKPGWYIVSQHALYDPRRELQVFQQQQPVETIGSVYHVYRLDAEQIIEKGLNVRAK